MSIKERIKELCDKQGISMNKLEDILGFGKGYCSKLDGKHKPNTAYIQKIADYFSVTVDYLMTGKEKEYTIEIAETDVELSKMEERLKEYALKLSKLSKSDQDNIMYMIDSMSNKGE